MRCWYCHDHEMLIFGRCVHCQVYWVAGNLRLVTDRLTTRITYQLRLKEYQQLLRLLANDVYWPWILYDFQQHFPLIDGISFLPVEDEYHHVNLYLTHHLSRQKKASYPKKIVYLSVIHHELPKSQWFKSRWLVCYATLLNRW